MHSNTLRRFGLILSLLALTSSPSFAATPGFVLPDDAEQRVGQLTAKIHWYEDIDQGKREAKYQHKMVLWRRCLVASMEPLEVPAIA